MPDDGVVTEKTTTQSSPAGIRAVIRIARFGVEIDGFRQFDDVWSCRQSARDGQVPEVEFRFDQICIPGWPQDIVNPE